MSDRRGRLFVIAGPSGVGKGSIVHELLLRDPDLVLSISCTTRPPRDGEVDGVDYRFCSPRSFQSLIDDGALLEWAEVFGNRYGTPAAAVEEARSEGHDVLLEIDVQGAAAVRDRLGADAVLIFIEPPSLEELERRLIDRETEDLEEIQRRLSQAGQELAQADRFDHQVVNRDLARAVDQVAAIIEAYRAPR